MRPRTLSIGLLAPPWVAVPPPAYGGTESVVSELARGLVAAGHDVMLYATGDSTAPVPVLYELTTGASDRIGASVVELTHVMHGYEALAGCDVVHDHTLLGPAWALACGHERVVTTCHGPFDGELRAIYRRYGKRLPVIAISQNQAASAPEIAVDRVIHHGIDPDQYPVGRGDGGYLLFLGRMTPDKGVREAVAIARAAGQHLVIAAKAREAAERAGIEIRYYNIIYDLVDDVKKAMSGLLAPSVRETTLGSAVILEIFKVSKVGNVAGCRVTEGTVERGANVRLVRDNVVVHEGKLSQLKRFKDDAREVVAGQECGMAFENYHDMRVGDVIECFRTETVQRTL